MHRLKKKGFFRRKSKRGGGGLAESKISVNRKKLRIFWIFLPKGGGLTQSKRVLSEKMRFLGIFCQKGGILSEKNWEKPFYRFCSWAHKAWRRDMVRTWPRWPLVNCGWGINVDECHQFQGCSIINIDHLCSGGTFTCLSVSRQPGVPLEVYSL